ncbi:ArsR/SmtB family transcription factor [Cellulomonas sp. P22]
MSVGNPEDASRQSESIDASAFKAYAHPLRLRMIQYLNDHGSATATELAQHLGESTGQTSYHLRQLAKHGLIEDDPARGKGRERWWRSRPFAVDGARLSTEDPTMTPAVTRMLHSVARTRAEALDDWFSRALQLPGEWLTSSVHRQSTADLTPEETTALNAEVSSTIDRYVSLSRARAERGETPADARRVRTYYDAFPLAADGNAAETGTTTNPLGGPSVDEPQA